MLKALELTGFKSFADRTKFQFPAGVTVVVGPNGSGKSNVVDAMKWVMGTQSAKSLRGGEMRDVIFNGARSRKPMNAAEVTLTLDNDKKTFPHEGAEIQVTRRVYRSGESEYLLNRQPCRLRDIRDLLSSAGIANEAYGIIEQGKVDALLQSSPQDRRAIFEEAAGINRFRAKKQEAARRLARVEQNLLRLTDIVGEVESRLKSIRSQAGKAQRYREQADRLRQLRTQVGLADWRKFSENLTRVVVELRTCDSTHNEMQRGIAEAEAKLGQQEAALNSLASEIRAEEAALGKSREALAERKSKCFVLSQRIDTLDNEVTRARRQLLALSTRTEGRGDADRDISRELEFAQQECANANEQFVRFKTSLARSHREVISHRDRLEALRQSQADVMGQLSAATQQEQALRGQCESARASAEVAAGEMRQLTAKLDAIDAELREAQRLEAAAVQEATKCSAELAEAQRRLEDRRRELTGYHKQLAAVDAELSRLEHRAELLEEQHRRIAKLEEDLQSLRQRIGSPDNAELFHGQVADVVRVEADFAPLVETALGERARDIILGGGRELLEAVEQSSRFANRLVFSRLDWRSPASAVDRVDLHAEPGVLGRADQFVETEELFQPLVKRLLGRTWLVDTLETGFRLAESVGKGLHFVTAAGELLSAEGVIAIGPRTDSAGLLTWRAELQEIQHQLVVERHRRDELQAAIRAHEEDANRDAAAVQDRLAAHAPLAEQAATLGQNRAALTERHEQLTAQIHRLQQRETSRSQELAVAQDKLSETAERSRQLQNQTQRLALEIQSTTAGANELEVRCNQLREATTERQVAIAKAEQHLEILRGQAVQYRRDQRQRKRAVREAHERLATAIADLQQHERDLLALEAVVAELAIQQESLAQCVRQAYERESELRTNRNGLTQRLQRLRNEAEKVAGKHQQMELKRNEIDLNRRTLAERMQEDFAIDLAAAADEPQPLPLEEDASRAELDRAIAELRSSLNVIGPVNLDAIEELEELESRFDSLSAQHRDLTQAKAAVEQLFRRINQETRELFVATLEAVRGHFRELFRQLFGGGEADLLLVTADGEDVLDGGVEITACPPGKDMRTISLLSGGEKTLTCIALLLAVFRNSPSPFCILDEVDAALDEANIVRFSNVLREFLSSTQFVVVTHSKRTMSAAQTLLGVTMQESGISKQIAVRLEDVDEEGNFTPTASARMAA